jgi:hypothetical protein
MTTLTEDQKEQLLTFMENISLSEEDMRDMENEGLIEPITSFTDEDMKQWDEGEIEVVRVTVQ